MSRKPPAAMLSANVGLIWGSIRIFLGVRKGLDARSPVYYDEDAGGYVAPNIAFKLRRRERKSPLNVVGLMVPIPTALPAGM